VSRARRRAKALEMLDLVRLGDFARHHPWQLSGGMQQRVAIARALSADPGILFMDEPLGALDEMNREHLQSELLRIWQNTGTTIVFVTHSISEAVFLSNRTVIMSPRPGRITEVIDIDLPYPRTAATRSSEGFFDAVRRVRAALHGVLAEETV
jgi:NitT/TauT family transport system ATP-binding protein